MAAARDFGGSEQPLAANRLKSTRTMKRVLSGDSSRRARVR
jgi:hypothetical protein